MNNEVLEKIQEIAREIFEDENLVLSAQTVATDVPGWDSLSHLTFVNEIENEFHIKLTMGEIQGSKNVGEFVEAVERHLQND